MSPEDIYARWKVGLLEDGQLIWEVDQSLQEGHDDQFLIELYWDGPELIAEEVAERLEAGIQAKHPDGLDVIALVLRALLKGMVDPFATAGLLLWIEDLDEYDLLRLDEYDLLGLYRLYDAYWDGKDSYLSPFQIEELRREILEEAAKQLGSKAKPSSGE